MLLLTSLVGLCVAGYFSLLAYGMAPLSAGRLPRWCRMDERSCTRVLTHRDAHLTGVPNALVGVAYYATLLLFAAGVLPPALHAWLAAAAWVSVAAGAYLTWSLLARVKVACRLCLLAHALNLGIAMLLTWG